MKKNLLLLSGLIFITYSQSQAQQLISYQTIATYTNDQIDSIYTASPPLQLILTHTYGITIYKVDYYTLDAAGDTTLASGAFLVPQNPFCHSPLVSYQHGTEVNKTEVPSTLLSGEMIIGISLATDGCCVCMPDYLGLGDSPGLHPYLHAGTEARATADLLVVARQIMDSVQLTWNNQLFLVGYSQGGHATMAANQLIQEQYGSYFKVTACIPMSGPYDMSGIQAASISADVSYPNPGYLPYVLLAYNSVYNIYASNSDFLAAPYDSILPPLFDGTHYMADVNAVMPDTPNLIIVPAVLDSFNNDPNYKLHGVLKENDTYHWTPQNFMRMYYCEADMDVNYLNAFVAYDTFAVRGAPYISKQSNGIFLDHTSCALPSLLNGKDLVDSFRLDKLKLTFESHDASDSGVANGSVTVHVKSGYPPYTYSWSNGGTDSTITGLVAGSYTVTVQDATGCPSSGKVDVGVNVGIETVAASEIHLFPNPMHDGAVIQLPERNNYSIEMADVSGIRIFEDHFSGNQYLLRRNNLPSGVYYISISKKNDPPLQKIMIVQ